MTECRHVATFTILWGVMLTLPLGVGAQAPPPRPAGSRPFSVDHSRQDDTTRITLYARRGVLGWRDVAQSLMAAEGLDESAVAGLLPDGSFSLESLSTVAAITGLNLAFDGVVRFSIDRNVTAPALEIVLRRDLAREKLRNFKAKVRQSVVRWQGAESPYELSLDEGWRERQDRPLVLLVHGYTARPGSMASLRAWLRKQRFATGVFGYPNDGAVTGIGRAVRPRTGKVVPRHASRQREPAKEDRGHCSLPWADSWRAWRWNSEMAARCRWSG